MVINGLIKEGEYYDSVTLMQIARIISALDGVIDAAVVMGTHENKRILESSGMLIESFRSAGDTDLLIAVKADSEAWLNDAFLHVDEHLIRIKHNQVAAGDYHPKSLEGALHFMPDANLALISVAGKYAAAEAMKALRKGLHVMLFSDNVSIEDEVLLKTEAISRGLMVMGPDCGTAIINGVPLAFANVVNRGDIGIVAASGTGLQEISCIISNEGSGISQAIGTGGRDVKAQVGGLMFIKALHALNSDEATRVISIVSKPPDPPVMKKIADALIDFHKPVVATFLGQSADAVSAIGAIPAMTLEDNALLSVALSQGLDLESSLRRIQERNEKLQAITAEISRKHHNHQKYLRGLFSGGTLCVESQIVMRPYLGDIYSNAPLESRLKLLDAWTSTGHTIVDLGDDAFTVGRPHPMIDFSLRNRRIIQEAHHDDVAVILLDVVIGYGAHPDPGSELLPVLHELKQITASGNRHITVVGSITGTAMDPQNKNQLTADLQEAGMIIMPSNAAASHFAAYIISKG